MYSLEENELNNQVSLLFPLRVVQEHLIAREKQGLSQKVPKIFCIYIIILDGIFKKKKVPGYIQCVSGT